jgi:hypothetical protein
MTQLELLKEPNQSFRYNEYEISIRSTNRATYISISRDDEVLISNQLLQPNELILKYDYLITDGNFIMQALENSLIDYTKFGNTQFLYFATNEDLEGI